MATEVAFLVTVVLREPDGYLTVSVYRKPTDTDQYSALPYAVTSGLDAS